MSEFFEPQKAEQPIDLKDPALAAFLAWLIPGLGHLYQGRKAKAGLFFVCIIGTFLYGMYLGSDLDPGDGKDLGIGRVVYFSWRANDKRLPYLCQAGIGLPVLPALVQANRMSSGKEVWCGGLMAPPRDPSIRASDPNDPNSDQPTGDDLHRYLHRYYELGTVFTMIAGLLNVLAIFDAWAGPVFAPIDEDDEDDDESGETDAEIPA